MRFWLLALSFLVCWKVATQEYAFRSYSVAEGLPQSQVTCITQDQQGFLWVGTLGGLASFSGREFVSYSVDQGLLNNRVSFVGIVDDTLWVGHENGVSQKNGNVFTPYRASNVNDADKFTAIVKFNDKLFAASNGSGLYQLKNQQLIKHKVTVQGIEELDEFDRIRDLHIVGNRLYTATRMGLFWSSDGTNFNLVNGTAEYSFSSLEYSAQHGLLVSSYGDGIFQLKNGTFKVLDGAKFVDEESIKHVLSDHAGHVWLSTKLEGVFRIEAEKFMQLNTSNGLPLDNVSCVYEDNAHGIWIGTEGKGLIYFTGEAFVHYTTKSGLSSDLIISSLVDKAGNKWFGTYANGVTRWSNNKWENFDLADGLSNSTIWSMAESADGSIWLGTANGLNRYRNNRFEFWDKQKLPKLPGNKISALYFDQQQRLWIGGGEGMACLVGDSIQTLQELVGKHQQIKNVRRIGERDGEIYFISQNAFHIITAKNTLLTYVISETKPTLYTADKDVFGNIWIGSEEGLFVYRNGEITPLNYDDFSGSNFINFIKCDKNLMWVGTNNGLFRFMLEDESLKDLRTEQFGIADGLVSLETNLNSAMIDQFDALWFGTSEGLMKFNRKDENVYASHVAPILNFSSVTVNFQSYDSLRLDRGLRLKHHQNRLVFSFTGVTMSAPEELKFQHYLKGFNDDWSPVSASNEVTFSGLSPGDYALHVRAISKNGQTSNEIIIPIHISPPFFQTWWFISLSLMTIFGIIFLIFKVRINQERERRRRQQREFSAKLQNLEHQSLNASMNRHFIFNALNSIQYFINTQDKLSANKYLSQFAKLIRKNLDTSSSERNDVTLSEEIERLQLYLSLEAMRFPDRFDYTFTIDESIDSETLKVPSMIFQPFIENSIIHGILPRTDQKGHITFEAKRNGSIIDFIIEDNGIGYQNSLKKKVAQGDHQSRGMHITSSRIDLLRIISGKTFQLIGPVDMKNATNQSIGTRVHIKMQVDSLEN
jgi:ligand-binding sensor domain-containing protein/two-component sensor histidine kinase